MSNLPAFVSPLSDLAVIQASGTDAVSFMQSQLTQDVANLATDQATLGGYCTAKGRLLATMVLWSAPLADDTPCLYALVKADVAEALVKRLTMFVLRAKVQLTVAPLSVWGLVMPPPSTDEFPAGGLADAGITSAAAHFYTALEVLPVQPQPYSCIHTDTGVWIATPSSTASAIRWWHISPILNAAEQADQGWWNAADIAAGLPWVSAAIQDIFIPQTVNLDLINAVSFSKGCYPGQEVVARSHYRGTVKRRMAYGTVKAPVATEPEQVNQLTGTDIFDANQPDNPCGRVINAASGADGRLHLLLEVQLADLGTADFRLGQNNAPAIVIQDLPYAIQSDSVA